MKQPFKAPQIFFCMNYMENLCLHVLARIYAQSSKIIFIKTRANIEKPYVGDTCLYKNIYALLCSDCSFPYPVTRTN